MRYIDADKLLESVTKDDFNDWRDYDVFQFLVGEEAPTADVVPKSEVARLQEDVDRLQEINNRQVENIKLAKAEVAMEIFEEIADQLRGLFDFFRQDDCIRESCAIMLAISKIAELKKKYQEGE